MRTSDVIVIGAGLAGLTAAAVAAGSGCSVTLLTKGAGTLAFGGGTIDVLGYRDAHAVKKPCEDIRQMPCDHPYTIAGMDVVGNALSYFQDLCAHKGYPLVGSVDTNRLVLTVAGTWKPSCLIPKTMDASGMEDASVITVATFAGLKDFYPRLIINGLKRLEAYRDKQYCEITIQTGSMQGRDWSILDVARWVESGAGYHSLVDQMRSAGVGGGYLLIPPVLGTEPDYSLWRKLEEALACRIVELAAPPPAITGSRLRMLLLRYLKELGVRIIEQAHVRRGLWRGTQCQGVVTQHLDRERIYEAQHVILATGSFLGGGLEATSQGITETVFGFPVVPANVCGTESNGSLFDSHPIFQAGVAVNNLFRPCDETGQPVADNVHLAGSILTGYDYAREKSGNGVAVVTGYQAALCAISGVKK